MRVYLFKYSIEVQVILTRATREFSHRLHFLEKRKKKHERSITRTCLKAFTMCLFEIYWSVIQLISLCQTINYENCITHMKM